VRAQDAVHAGRMDDISLSSRTPLSHGEAQVAPRNAAAWTGACALIALTLAALVPPGIYVWLLARYGDRDGQVDHTAYVAAANGAMLMILFPAGGAALGALATLLSRPACIAGRVAAIAAGAFMASMVFTTGGFLWVLSHAQFQLTF
jgi:hypothetical protein